MIKMYYNREYIANKNIQTHIAITVESVKVDTSEKIVSFVQDGRQIDSRNIQNGYFSLKPKPFSTDITNKQFLNVFADIVEDLPGNVKFEPKRYEKCQLMTQVKGGFQYYYHHETKTELLIALNSNAIEKYY